jgi:agmatine/peptidylarginine deiminase
MTDHTLRLPAEWEPQSSVLIAWPHAGTDWADRLTDVPRWPLPWCASSR